jgi:hypothetical protein
MKRKKSKKRLGKMARTKGLAFERAVAIALRVVWPDCRRHLENHDAAANGVDLVNTGRYRFQCKRGRKYSNLLAIEEVQCDEIFGEIPVLVTQGDHKRILVALPLEEFIELISK